MFHLFVNQIKYPKLFFSLDKLLCVFFNLFLKLSTQNNIHLFKLLYLYLYAYNPYPK